MSMLGKILIAITILLYGELVNAEKSCNLYFIDAHSQIDHKISGVEVVLKRMSANNVKTTLLSARGKRNWRDILDWSAEYPTKIAPLIRSKGKHYLNSSPRYNKMVRKQIETGEFIGGAEILVFHAKKGNKAPEVEVDLTDERFSLLLTESLRQGWPAIIHIEFASLPAKKRQPYIDELNTLLEQHPEHPFLLIHMGQLYHDQVQKLIERNPNIYFLTSHTDPVTVNNSRQPWINVFSASGNQFQVSWRDLFNAYPDRFVFALDNVWDSHWNSSYDEKMKHWRKALYAMPANTAGLIAHGNAERLWELK